MSSAPRGLRISIILVALAVLAAGAVVAQSVVGRRDAATLSAAGTGTVAKGLAVGNAMSFMSEAQLDRLMGDAAAAGVTSVRGDFSWRLIQAGGRTAYDWAQTDRIVEAANRHGVGLLPILTETPDWARRLLCVVPGACPPRDPDDFARFARAAAERYAPLGVRAWEIWNEPNLARFWAVPNPLGYGRLFVAAQSAITSVDPGATVLLGGLAGGATLIGGGLDPRPFLRGVCLLTSACRVASGLAYHPYTDGTLPSKTNQLSAWAKISRTTPSLRSVLADSGVPDLPIWLTEVGAPTGSNNVVPNYVTESVQAQIVQDAYATARTEPGVVSLYWYSYRDEPGLVGAEAFFGLKRADGSPKPAWQVFVDVR